jgi:hypothetical protein
MPAQQRPAVIMEEVIETPEERAKAQVGWAQFDLNWAWFQAHVPEIYSQYRGKCICIAGEEIFAADTPEEVIALGTAAHPEDQGRFVHYIPREKLVWIYAN